MTEDVYERLLDLAGEEMTKAAKCRTSRGRAASEAVARRLQAMAVCLDEIERDARDGAHGFTLN